MLKDKLIAEGVINVLQPVPVSEDVSECCEGWIFVASVSSRGCCCRLQAVRREMCLLFVTGKILNVSFFFQNDASLRTRAIQVPSNQSEASLSLHGCFTPPNEPTFSFQRPTCHVNSPSKIFTLNG